MHSNYDDTNVFLRKFCFIFSNFGKSVVLSLHYQLPFCLQSGPFPGKMNWTESQLDLVSLSSVLDVWNPSKNLSTDRQRVFPWNIEVQSKSSSRGGDGFSFEVWLNAVCMLRLSPIHLTWKPTTLEKRQLVVYT